MQHLPPKERTNSERDGAVRVDNVNRQAATPPLRSDDTFRGAGSTSNGEILIGEHSYIRQPRLAKLLNVSSRTLARWNARGIGPPRIVVGKMVLFDLAKVPDWLATREVGSTRNRHR